MGRTYYDKPKRIEKISREEKVDLMFDLINSFSSLKSPAEAADFLEDLLTANEIKNLSVRLRIAKLLLGDKPQREISTKLHTSLATINKVNVWLNSGGEGFKRVIAKLPLKWEKPANIPHGLVEFHLPELLLATSQYIVANNQEKVPKKLIEKMVNKQAVDRGIEEVNKETYSRK